MKESRLILLFFLICVAPAMAQQVTITFSLGSELTTKLDSLTVDYVLTPQGPYHYRSIKKMTFPVALPDSASIQRLQAKDIEVYFKMKRVARIVPKPAPYVATPRVIPPAIPVQDSTKAPAPKDPVTPKSSASSTVWTAKKAPREYNATSSSGIGLGLDYGGIGWKLTIYPTGPVSIFGGLGYNFNAVGYNGGLELNFAPHKKSTAFVSAMYGYNAVLIQPSGSTQSSQTFYGPSFGFGAKFRSKSRENFFMFQLIYPIRDQEFLNAQTTEQASPILFSVGYHFAK